MMYFIYAEFLEEEQSLGTVYDTLPRSTLENQRNITLAGNFESFKTFYDTIEEI